MYAVIFRARLRNESVNYSVKAAQLRDKAFKDYRCVDFIAVNENDYEVAISYWQSLEDILAWKQDQEHLAAQAEGRSSWYDSYRVEVVEIKKSYTFEQADQLEK